jgi:diguanylate cyclase (GGDEF)-like protein/PAS domain S-box-containing protein
MSDAGAVPTDRYGRARGEAKEPPLIEPDATYELVVESRPPARWVTDILALGGAGIAFAIGAAAVLAGMGVSGWIGWLSAGDAPMSPTTGIGLVLAAAGLVTWRLLPRRRHPAGMAVGLEALLLLGLGLAALVHDVFGGGEALQDVLGWGSAPEVAPSLLSGVALVLSAVALGVLAVRERSSLVVDVSGGLVFWIGLLGITERIFHASISYELGIGSKLSSPASIAFLALGLALVLIDREGPLAGRLRRVGAGGRLLRSAFPFVLLGSLSISFLTRLLSQGGALSVGSADVLGVNAMTVLVLAAGWMLSGALDRADDRVRSAETTLRMVTETVDDAFWVTSADGEQLLYLSPGYERIFGTSASALKADPTSWLQSIHPDDRANVLAGLAGLGDPSGVSGEWRVVRPDGGTRWVRGRAWVVRDRFGKAVRLVGVGQDVTEIRKAELEREQSELRFREVAERLDEGLWIMTPSGDRLLYSNAACVHIFGWGVDEFSRHPHLLPDSIHPHDRDRVQQSFQSGSLDEKFRLLRPDGTVRWVRDRGFAIHDAAGEVHRMAGLVSDITNEVKARQALEQSEARYRHQALHDPLTDLANRALFMDRVEHALAYREGGRATVMLVDLDRFKSVNDTLGHAAGDDLLRQVAARLRDCLRPEDTGARLGGDEFGVLITTPREDIAEELGRRIASTLSEPYALADAPGVSVTASVGLAVRSSDNDTAEALVCQADLAMYQAKVNGGARYMRFQPETNTRPHTAPTPAFRA